MGARDSINPERMTISASSEIAKRSVSSAMAGSVGETNGRDSTANMTGTSGESRPCTSSLDDSPLKANEKNELKKGGGKTPKHIEKKDTIEGNGK